MTRYWIIMAVSIALVAAAAALVGAIWVVAIYGLGMLSGVAFSRREVAELREEISALLSDLIAEQSRRIAAEEKAR